MNDIPKSCSTCEHRYKTFLGHRCAHSGYFCEVERKYGSCGAAFRAWVPRLGFTQRVKLAIVGSRKRDGE